MDQIDRFRSKVGKRQPLKEALQRVYVDLLLFNCLLDEDIALQDPRASINEVHSTTTPVRSQRTGITASDFAPGPVPAPMGLYFETELRAPISFKGEKRMLCGFADWSLGHFSGGSGSGNLVLVEAKKRDYIRESYGQLAAYMGMMRSLMPFHLLTHTYSYLSRRKEEGREEQCSSLWDCNGRSGLSLLANFK